MSTQARSRHWAHMGETTFVAGIWLLYGAHRLLGRRIFRALMAPVVLVHWLARPAVREASLQYLQRLQAAEHVFDEEPGARHSLRHLMLFAETLLDKLLAMAGRFPLERVRISGDEFLRAAQPRRGGLLVTAHMGCLELCQVLARRQQGIFTVHVLVHTRHAESFNRLLARLDPHARLNLIEVTEISAATAVMLGEKVAAGDFVAIAGDRVPVQGERYVRVNFLGHSAPLPIGPYVLASLLRCPLYLLGCIHEGEGYALSFEQLAERVELPRATREAALAQYAQAFADAVTKLLRRSPYDWFNFYPFWEPHDSRS